MAKLSVSAHNELLKAEVAALKSNNANLISEVVALRNENVQLKSAVPDSTKESITLTKDTQNTYQQACLALRAWDKLGYDKQCEIKNLLGKSDKSVDIHNILSLQSKWHQHQEDIAQLDAQLDAQAQHAQLLSDSLSDYAIA